MSNKTLNLTESLYDYLLSVSLRETAILQELRQLTAGYEYANMQIAPEQGQFMAFLVQLLQARRIIEIGTFTGYSSLCMAQAMPEDGKLITCDVDTDATAVAKQFWDKAGVAHKIDLRLAPALATLDELLREVPNEHYDMAFLDAVKTEYQAYFDRVIQLMRPGGVILIDNVLWSGRPADPAIDDDNTVAIREFNARLVKDERVVISLLPIADGLTLAMKR